MIRQMVHEAGLQGEHKKMPLMKKIVFHEPPPSSALVLNFGQVPMILWGEAKLILSGGLFCIPPLKIASPPPVSVNVVEISL